MLKVQAPFSSLENGENKQSTPLVDEVKLSEEEWNNFKLRMYFQKKEMMYSLKQDVRFLIYEKAKTLAEGKQVFISAYLQDLHIYLSTTLGLRVPSLKLVKDGEFDDSKFCRIIKILFFTSKELSKFYASTIGILQSIGFALTCSIICQSASLLRMRN